VPYKLTVTKGPQRGRTFLVVKTETKLGRDPVNDIVLPDEYVSRLHANIVTRGKAHVVVNASPNGTLVNGKRVDKARLKDGDEITLGAATVLQYSVQVPPGVAARGKTPEDETEPEGEREREAGPQAKSLLLQRPKILAATLVYVALLAGLGIFLATRKKKTDLNKLPPLTRDMIRRDLDRDVQRDIDKLEGDRALKRAMDLYDQRYVAPGNLYSAIVAFKEAEAYLGTRLRTSEHIRARNKAMDELEDKIMDLYFLATALQNQGRYNEARDYYTRILQHLNDPDARTFQNVTRRIKVLQPFLDRPRWGGP